MEALLGVPLRDVEFCDHVVPELKIDRALGKKYGRSDDNVRTIEQLF